MLLGWLLAWAHAGDCDPTTALTGAEAAVVQARLEIAREALNDAEVAFGCGGVASTADLARLWMIEGAIETFAGDPATAAESFQAAARIEPELWIDALGGQLKEARDKAAAADPLPTGTVEVEGAPKGYFGAVDGESMSFPVSLDGGLHLVQVGRSAEDITWAKIVYLPPTQRLVLKVPAFDMEPPPAETAEPVGPGPEPEVPGPKREASTGLFAHAAIGGGAALGEAQDLRSPEGDTLSENAVKLAVPIEVGLTIRGEGFWLRGAAGGGPLLGGLLVYGVDGGAAGWPASVFAHGSGGASLGDADLGLLAGMSLPGRIETRAVASYGLGAAPLRAELRAGVNLPTERSPEPAFGLFFAWDPSR